MRTAKLVAVALLALSSAVAAVDDDHQEVRARPGQTLDLRLRAGAGVHIIGDSSGDTVVVDVTDNNNRYTGNTRVEVRQTSRGVEVVSEYNSRDQRSSLQISVHVPRRFDVSLESTGGSFDVENLEGTFTGSTNGGNLNLAGVSGRVDLKTLGGNIHVADSELEGHLVTNGGNVTFDNVGGGVTASSMGGNVVYRNSRRTSPSTSTPASPSPPPGSAKGRTTSTSTATSVFTATEVRISTMGGDISVPEAAAGATVSTNGGNIHIIEADEFVSARTLGGDIIIDAADGWIEARTNGGNITATMVGDPRQKDRHVRLTSLGGDVTLIVPRGLGMRVNVRLAHTRNSRRDYHIDGSVRLNTRVDPNWDYSKGTARRYTYGTGTFGDGRNTIDIETIDGDVRLETR